MYSGILDVIPVDVRMNVGQPIDVCSQVLQHLSMIGRHIADQTGAGPRVYQCRNERAHRVVGRTKIIGLQNGRRQLHSEISAAVARSTVAVDERERVADAQHFVASAIDVREPIRSSALDRPPSDGHFGVAASGAWQDDVSYHLRRGTERGRHDDHRGPVHYGHVIGHGVLATHAAAVDIKPFAIASQWHPFAAKRTDSGDDVRRTHYYTTGRTGEFFYLCKLG